DRLYDKVNSDINIQNQSDHYVNLEDYKANFKRFDFRKIHEEFKLIDTQTTSVFVPLNIDRKWFTKNELAFLDAFGNDHLDIVQGEKVFNIYKNIIFGEGDFIKKTIDKKQIGGVMSKFMFSIFTNSNLNKELLSYCDHEDEAFEKFGLIYLSHYQNIYSL